MQIPKIIHYCWFGRNPLPPLAIKCIESWKKYLPDYEIKEWNEDNFDVNIIPYTAEAYKAKKYAFVSDYARFWILYKYGGLYFDTDVEVIKPMDDIIQRGAFMGFEMNPKGNKSGSIAPGLGLGTLPKTNLYTELLKMYDGVHFNKEDGALNQKTIVEYTTEVLIAKGLENKKGIQFIEGVYIYPSEYFCPIDIVTKRLHITKNTRTIHHYAASWKDISKMDKIKSILRSFMPDFILLLINHYKNKK